MRIRLATEGKGISVDIAAEEVEEVFNDLALQLLGLSPQEETGIEHEALELAEELRPVVDIPEAEDNQFYQYRGFMYIKCPECGEVKGFCYKEEKKGYHCFECHSDMGFSEELKRLYVRCQCGRTSRYMTNMSDGMFDINCIDCGNPVAVKWDDKRQKYETI